MEKGQMSITDNINSMCEYFKKQINVIQTITVGKTQPEGTSLIDYETRKYRKVLLVTLLDAMANIRFLSSAYPKLNRSNQERFVRFVREYGEWKDGSLISVPFLYDRLCTVKDRAGDLRSFLECGCKSMILKSGDV